MKIAKSGTQIFHNGQSCILHKYVFPSSLIGLVTADIDGRYPEQGKVLNEICDEVYYVLAGSCTVHHEAVDHKLSEGDVFFFTKGKSWWLEANRLTLVACTAPPWTPEQHRSLA